MELRAYREGKSLSLEDMAARIGCSVSALSLIERGKRTPGYALTMRIVSATGNKVKEADLHSGGNGLEIGRGGGRK